MRLTVEFKIEGHDITVGETAEMWVDIDGSGILTENERVRLYQDNLTWTGSIESSLGSPNDMLFIIKFIASPRTARWTLKIKSDQPNEHEVFSKTDDVRTLTSRFIGRMRA